VAVVEQILSTEAAGDREGVARRELGQSGTGVDVPPAAADQHQRLGGVEFRQEFPRNALGKVLKRVLREPYWAAVTSSTG
jgi:acyl-CoA synthetase (AMP-forming)/AMP-acid ligase II